MRTRMMGIWLAIGLVAGSGQALAQNASAPAAGDTKPVPAVTGQTPAAAKPEAAPAAAPEGSAKPRTDAQAGGPAAKKVHPVKGSPAVEAVEKRYEDYLAKEKADSDAALAKQRGMMEDKYKGFVRTVKPRAGSKAAAKKDGE